MQKVKCCCQPLSPSKVSKCDYHWWVIHSHPPTQWFLINLVSQNDARKSRWHCYPATMPPYILDSWPSWWHHWANCGGGGWSQYLHALLSHDPNQIVLGISVSQQGCIPPITHVHVTFPYWARYPPLYQDSPWNSPLGSCCRSKSTRSFGRHWGEGFIHLRYLDLQFPRSIPFCYRSLHHCTQLSVMEYHLQLNHSLQVSKLVRDSLTDCALKFGLVLEDIVNYSCGLLTWIHACCWSKASQSF